MNIAGVDFSLHGGADLMFVNSPNGVVTDCNFKSESGAGIIQTDAYSPGLTVQNSVMDGDGAVGTSSLISVLGGGPVTLLNNVFQNYPQHVIEMNYGGSLVYEYNLIEDGGMQPGAHLNMLQIGGTGTTTATVEYNTVYQQPEAAGAGEGFQFCRPKTDLPTIRWCPVPTTDVVFAARRQRVGTVVSGLKASNYFDPGNLQPGRRGHLLSRHLRRLDDVRQLQHGDRRVAAGAGRFAPAPAATSPSPATSAAPFDGAGCQRRILNRGFYRLDDRQLSTGSDDYHDESRGGAICCRCGSRRRRWSPAKHPDAAGAHIDVLVGQYEFGRTTFQPSGTGLPSSLAITRAPNLTGSTRSPSRAPREAPSLSSITGKTPRNGAWTASRWWTRRLVRSQTARTRQTLRCSASIWPAAAILGQLEAGGPIIRPVTPSIHCDPRPPLAESRDRPRA